MLMMILNCLLLLLELWLLSFVVDSYVVVVYAFDDDVERKFNSPSNMIAAMFNQIRDLFSISLDQTD